MYLLIQALRNNHLLAATLTLILICFWNHLIIRHADMFGDIGTAPYVLADTLNYTHGREEGGKQITPTT